MGRVGLEYIKVEQPKDIDPVRARFSDAPWLSYLKKRAIIVVGAGGIGSWVTMCLSRIGCSVVLYDKDIFEVHNMGGQMVALSQIGLNKADAVRALCAMLVGPSSSVNPTVDMYDENCPTSPIMIAAVDNMQARKIIFDKWSKIYGNSKDAILIDGRLLAEDYQVYGVTTDRLSLYSRTLFSDSDVPTENCTLKSTTHCSLGIASDIVGILTNFAANAAARDTNSPEVRDIPFRIVKSIPNFLYDITFETDDTGTEKRIDITGDVPVHTEQLHEVQ